MRLNQVKLFSICLIIYYILTALFPNIGYGANQSSERIYPQITMGIIGVYCLYSFLLNVRKLYVSSFMRPFLIYMFLSLFYIFWILPSTSLFGNFLYVLKFDMAILVMFVFYLFLRKNRERTLKYIFIIFWAQFLYAIVSLFTDRFIIQSHAAFFNSNTGFLLVSSIPMTMILPKKRMRIYVYLAIVMGCLFSGQRSAALAAIISFPWCFKYIKQNLRIKDIIFLSVLGIIALYPIVQISIDNIMYRINLDSSNGNIGAGRSIFWIIVFKQFFQNDLLHWFFGNGYYSVQNLLLTKYGMAIEAHNGWLQTLYVFGFLGFIIYLKMCFSLLTKNRFVNRVAPAYKNIFMICFIVFFVKCSTSHGNWDISMIPFSLVLAIIADQIQRNTTKFRIKP